MNGSMPACLDTRQNLVQVDDVPAGRRPAPERGRIGISELRIFFACEIGRTDAGVAPP